jgi:hypothetical protein
MGEGGVIWNGRSNFKAVSLESHRHYFPSVLTLMYGNLTVATSERLDILTIANTKGTITLPECSELAHFEPALLSIVHAA